MYNDTAMKRKTFRGGVHLPEHKELTVDKKIKTVPAGTEVVIPLGQHIGSPNTPIVKAGDAVKVGEGIYMNSVQYIL